MRTIAIVVVFAVVFVMLVTVFCACVAASRADDMDEAFREHLKRQRDPGHNGPER